MTVDNSEKWNVFMTKEEKIQILEALVNSYIFKDILALAQIKGSKLLLDLLKLLSSNPPRAEI